MPTYNEWHFLILDALGSATPGKAGAFYRAEARKYLDRYQCPRCNWRGDRPSLSDASELDADGVMQRTHIALCPRCFAKVETV